MDSANFCPFCSKLLASSIYHVTLFTAFEHHCRQLGQWFQLSRYLSNNNKFPQSNLGRGPCRSTAAHVCRKVPIGYNSVPEMCPQKYPFLWTDPQTPLSASSLDPSDLWCQTASRSDPPFFQNALDRQTDRQADRPTDHPRKSLMTIGRCATRETRPNNNNNNSCCSDIIAFCFTIHLFEMTARSNVHSYDFLLSTHADRHVVDISVTVCLFVCLFVSLSAGIW